MRYTGPYSRFSPQRPAHSPREARNEKLRKQRMHMVTHLQGMVQDPVVLKTMLEVPRHLFVSTQARDIAYEDRPIAISQGQTLSAPHIIAHMLELAKIKADHRVLEIGTGSGYQTALLSHLAKTVYSLEVHPRLLEKVHQVLGQWGYRNVHLKVGNGFLGWPARAPYDRILVSAAVSEVPQPLIEQLAIGGKLVIPVGEATEAGVPSDRQRLQVITKTELGQTLKESASVTFEPMIPPPPMVTRWK